MNPLESENEYLREQNRILDQQLREARYQSFLAWRKDIADRWDAEHPIQRFLFRNPYR
jgi:hypothetical protein